MSNQQNIVKVACINLNPIVQNKIATLNKIKHFIIHASKEGANIVVFPETALTGYVFPLDMTAELAEPIPGPATEEIAGITKQCNVYVIVGMVESDKERPNIYYNSAAVVGPNGVLGSYRKVHPAAWELRWCHKGTSYPIFETRYGPIGVGICYDNYCFPEVARLYALKGVRLLIHPTAFPQFADVEAKDYRDFYKTTLGARSIENQMFIASANLVGVEENLTFIGYSAIFGPKPGSMNYHIWAGPAGTSEEMIIATLDLASVQRMPDSVRTILEDRQPNTYRQLSRTSVS